MHGEYWDKKKETLKREELEKLQFKLLKYQVKRCYENSSFYRLKFKKAGFYPWDLRKLDDVSKIPFLYKGELREEQRRYGPSRYIVTSKNLIEAYATSGTTGPPILSFWTHNDREYIVDVTARTLWAMGMRPGLKVQNAFSYELWPPGFAVHYAVQRIGGFVLPIGGGKSMLQSEFIIGIQPDVLISTPTLALRIAKRLQEMGVDTGDLSLKFGAFGGDIGAAIPNTRDLIEKLLNLDAYDYYGIIEIGPTFAGECKEKSGLHWSEDYHLVEVIDPNTGERVSEGEKGVLVLTHLVKEATPMIRYWTGDLTEIEYEKCGCGRTFARSPRGILGRTDDMISYQGINFYPSDVENIIREFPELGVEYVIRQDRDRCVLEIEYDRNLVNTKRDLENLRDEIRERIEESLGIRITVKLVDKIIVPYIGVKARRVIVNI
ncbi:CoA ligase [Archaeoglobales archaeon ex4484_92]|nr:MAG: CoA ligase [Archaeoglobales archaeon ex4484_92]RLG19169.1 MAG: phenylacetate--CoA ligase family protein [Nanoarchaeota archaeon]